MVVERGADFVELGVPFSDPLADGPTIQQSSHVALQHGMTVEGVLQLLSDVRPAAPVIVFGYLNPLLAYGMERFLHDAQQAGAAGVLVTDLPPGEDPELEAMVRASALALIPLVAPTTRGDRLEQVLRKAEGFVYLIARLGVTGAQTSDLDAVGSMVGRVRHATSLPIAVGFGIRDGTQAAAVARVADGVVVGSALVERLAQGMDPARALLDGLRRAIDDSDRAA